MSKVVHLATAEPARSDAFWRNEARRLKAHSRNQAQTIATMTAERVYFARAWRVAVQLSDGKLEVVLREIMGMTDTEYLAWFDTLDHPQS